MEAALGLHLEQKFGLGFFSLPSKEVSFFFLIMFNLLCSSGKRSVSALHLVNESSFSKAQLHLSQRWKVIVSIALSSVELNGPLLQRAMGLELSQPCSRHIVLLNGITKWGPPVIVWDTFYITGKNVILGLDCHTLIVFRSKDRFVS